MNLFVIISASLGYATESIFGFGGSIVTFLLLTQSVTAKEAVSMLPLFAIAGSLFILLSDYRSVRWAVVGRILLFALPGLVLGSLLMRYIPEMLFRLFVLAIILLYGFNLVLGRDPSVPPVWRKPLYVLGDSSSVRRASVCSLYLWQALNSAGRGPTGHRSLFCGWLRPRGGSQCI